MPRVFAPLQVGVQIKSRVQELGHGCIYLVQKAGALQMSPTDSFTKRELIECARAVTEKVGLIALVSILQASDCAARTENLDSTLIVANHTEKGSLSLLYEPVFHHGLLCCLRGKKGICSVLSLVVYRAEHCLCWTLTTHLCLVKEDWKSVGWRISSQRTIQQLQYGVWSWKFGVPQVTVKVNWYHCILVCWHLILQPQDVCY